MDIVRDIFDRLSDKDQGLDEIERSIRADYGGERVYIPKDGDAARSETSMRNRAIRADWARGERIEYLVRRYQISRRRIYSIINMSV